MLHVSALQGNHQTLRVFNLCDELTGKSWGNMHFLQSYIEIQRSQHLMMDL